MSLIITRGYLINRTDYGTFDEILTFLNQYGNKFVCFAPGTRKINSKNARSLMYGNYLEFEFFYTNNDQKISKLKKVCSLSEVEFGVTYKLGLLIANDVLNLKTKTNQSDYKFYQSVLVYSMQGTNEIRLSVYCYLYFLLSFSKRTTDYRCPIHKILKTELNFFDNELFCCPKCYPHNIDRLDLQSFKFIAYALTLKDYKQLEEFCLIHSQNEDWQKIYNYLNYNFNHYRRTIYRNKKGKHGT